MSQPSCKIFFNKNKGGGLGFWTIIKMLKESFKEFSREETNEIGERLSIGGNAKKNGKAKERRMSSNGNGFRV